MRADLRYACRLLMTRKGFSAVVILTLALGIGVNSAFFSVINAALLRPLPVRAPEELVNVYTSRQDGSGFGALSYPDYRDLVERRDVFSGVIGYSGLMATLTSERHAEVLFGELVTGNYFSVLGIRPAFGRFFLPDEDRTPGTHPVVVLGNALWRRRFGSDTGVVGRSIALNGRAYTVIGVAPDEFKGMLFRGFSVDVWAPTAMMGQLRTDQLARRDERWMFVKARLRDGVSVEQARVAVASVGRQLANAFPESNAGRELRVLRSDDVLVSAEGDRAVVPAAAFLMAAVGVVLLIACTNLANLMLARASSRQREIAVRVALGASRGRLVRQLLVESTVLSLLGGAGGLLLAFWLSALLVAYKPPLPVALAFDVDIDARVVAFTLLLSLAANLLFGLGPAMHATKPSLVAALKERGGIASRRLRPVGGGARNLLLVPQVALSLLLLIVAALFGRSIANARAVNPGFDIDRTALIALNLGMSGYDDVRARRFYDELSRRVTELPGTAAVAVTDRIPLDIYGSQSATLSVEGGRFDVQDESTQYGTVGAGYFEALGIPLLHGRVFTPADVESRAPVAIVSAEAARRYWPGRSAIGQRIRLGDAGAEWREVVGVAADVKVQTLGERPQPFVYAPFVSGYPRLLRVVARTGDDPGRLITQLRRIVADLDPAVALFESKTMSENLDVMLFPFRMTAGVSSALGALALMLAAVGLYGVLAYGVAERTREIGIRLALGARAGAVVRAVVGDGLKVVALGLGLGLVLALAVSRVLAGWLFGIASTDPVTFLVTPLFLTAVAALAGVIPARRAVRVDPMVALRAE